MLLQNEAIPTCGGFDSISVNEIAMVRSVEVVPATKFLIRPATPGSTPPAPRPQKTPHVRRGRRSGLRSDRVFIQRIPRVRSFTTYSTKNKQINRYKGISYMHSFFICVHIYYTKYHPKPVIRSSQPYLCNNLANKYHSINT